MSEPAKQGPRKPGIDAALMRGEPLADFIIKFADGLDYVAVTERLNQIADDLFVHRVEWYNQPHWRLGVATRAALKREFGWVIRRGPIPGSPPNGGYYWEVVTELCRVPPEFEGRILEVGLTQPGGDDLGQPWDFDD
jgi:hypothetical protein